MTTRDDVVRAIAKRFREEVPSDNDVDITTWDMESELEDYSKLFLKAVVHCASRALKIALQEDALVEFVGNTTDSLALKITTPLGGYEGYGFGPVWKIGFLDAARFEIEMMGDLNRTYGTTLVALRDTMKILLAEIDQAITTAKKQQDADA
jgi:hypothetical protein